MPSPSATPSPRCGMTLQLSRSSMGVLARRRPLPVRPELSPRCDAADRARSNGDARPGERGDVVPDGREGLAAPARSFSRILACPSRGLSCRHDADPRAGGGRAVGRAEDAPAVHRRASGSTRSPGETFESLNPADRRDVIGRFQAGTAADVGDGHPGRRDGPAALEGDAGAEARRDPVPLRRAHGASTRSGSRGR